MKRKERVEKGGARRDFLRTGAAAGTGLVALAVLPAQAAARTADGSSKEKSGGYRLTDHVMAYYRSAAD